MRFSPYCFDFIQQFTVRLEKFFGGLLKFRSFKSVLPDEPRLVRVWFGPFRGARVVMNPRNSIRKIFGIYEHELNGWLETTLLHVNRVVDVGANDGYFTFGCAAAFMR